MPGGTWQEFLPVDRLRGRTQRASDELNKLRPAVQSISLPKEETENAFGTREDLENELNAIAETGINSRRILSSPATLLKLTPSIPNPQPIMVFVHIVLMKVSFILIHPRQLTLLCRVSVSFSKACSNNELSTLDPLFSLLPSSSASLYSVSLESSVIIFSLIPRSKIQSWTIAIKTSSLKLQP